MDYHHGALNLPIYHCYVGHSFLPTAKYTNYGIYPGFFSYFSQIHLLDRFYQFFGTFMFSIYLAIPLKEAIYTSLYFVLLISLKVAFPSLFYFSTFRAPIWIKVARFHHFVSFLFTVLFE